VRSGGRRGLPSDERHVIAWCAAGDDRVQRVLVFLFFSNRLGCLGSLLVSVVATLLLIALLRLL
jgi:hypothetical protein